MNLFRVRGIQLAVHFSFFLLVGYVAWQGWMGDPEQAIPGGWHTMLWEVSIVVLFFTCVVLHELGHSFTAMHFGVGVRRILLMPIGGMAEFDSIPRQPYREFLITLAGPAVNFALAAVLWLVVGMPEGWPSSLLADGTVEIALDARGMGQVLLIWNLIMGCFNLLPVFPMDGGRIFRALLATRMPYLRATFVAATCGKILALLCGAIAVLVWDQLLTGLLFTFIFFAGELEYRAVKRREQEDAHWRDVLARFHPPPPSEEPPILLR